MCWLINKHILRNIITKKMWSRKQFKYACSLTVLNCSAFNSAFVANALDSVFRSEIFLIFEMLDLPNNFIIFESNVSFVNILESKVKKCFPQYLII